MAISSCYPQGQHENGKWMRKQFSDRAEAETFAALKSVIVEGAVAARTIASCQIGGVFCGSLLASIMKSRD